jgi:hypothetical protein
MADTAYRFDLGFVGGGNTSGIVSEEQWLRLQGAFLSGDDSVIELEEASTRLWVRSSQIAWARLHLRESRIGF